MRYDEKSLFPKHILEMEAKMKAMHAISLRASRGTRARGDSVQARSRASHDAYQPTGKKLTGWKFLLANKNKE